ncbi:hypothetical protein K488DRAFT_86394 [Vararia minispora EC-137]|uniref:Uncharacterized protein n=1 Tax=Vararia minispora EC-137 TaxID=1314806 RepID=A0ACB8QKK5_9AGAM|nr:hypothetical protein K488DRAFT_86394 [Vararia minispora EC-137]
MSECLFQPIRINHMHLTHRVILAPLVRSRTSPDRVIGDLVKERYASKVTVSGTVLISVATFTMPHCHCGRSLPAFETDSDDARNVGRLHRAHARVLHLLPALVRRLDRIGHPEGLVTINPTIPYISAGVLTQADTKNPAGCFVDAAAAAVHEVGFDGVEIYEYKFWFPENTGRFYLEAMGPVVESVSANRVRIELDSWTRLEQFGEVDNGVKPADAPPVYTYVATELRKRRPGLADLQVLEPRIRGDGDIAPVPGALSDFPSEI